MPSSQEAKPAPTKDFAAIALQYSQNIVAGRLPACKWVVKACQRHLRDLKRTDWEWRFDVDRAHKACRFIERLPHTKGKWANERQRISLEPFQCFIVCSIFGWVDRATGRKRRIRTAYIKLPRKNAKSTLAAGIGLYMFVADGEFGAEVYCGATDEDQAWEVYRVAKHMVERTPELQQTFGILISAPKKNSGHGAMQVLSTGSRFETLVGKPGDGSSPSCYIGDEYHEHPTDEQRETMRTGMGARENPLELIITTSGSNRGGPCYAFERDCEKLLDCKVEDERTFALMYGVDEGDDWTSDEVLRKANPNFGVSVFEDYLKEQRNEAVRSARKQNTFKTKHLNVWVNASVAWMNMQAWDELADPTLKIEDFEKEDCHGGLDLASRSDLASKLQVFRRMEPNEKGEEEAHYYVFAKSYINQARVEEQKGGAYGGWVADGWLVQTPGNVTDYTAIADDLVHDTQRFYVRQVAHDPYHAAALVQFVQARDDWNQNAEFVNVPQTRQYISAPMKELEALVLAKRLHHNGDPVLGWAISNVLAKNDGRDNIIPEKEAPENKIDPATALIMALRQWVVAEPEPAVSIDFV